MNKNKLMIITVVSILVSACTGVSVEKAKIKTAQDSVSYVVGVDYGKGISQQMETFPGGVNDDVFLEAFIDNYNNEEATLTIEEAQAFIMKYIKATEKDTATVEYSEEDSIHIMTGSFYGLMISQQMSSFPGGMNDVAFVEAFVTSFSGDSAKIVVENAQEFVMGYVQEAQAAEAEGQAEKAKVEAKTNENAIAGAKFLEENATKKGVTTTASGLQYKVIKAGTGEKPTAQSTVSVHYHGTLIDGTVFDSSVDRGEPTSFGVSQVIPGWTEALQLMPVGSKWILYIPQDIAYGSAARGENLPAYSTLIFEVELLEIVK